MTDLVYSINGEDFRDCEPEDFIEEFDESDLKGKTEVTIYQGEPVRYKASDFYSEDLMELLQDRACEKGGDYAEGWLSGIPEEQYQEFETSIKNLIDQWAVKHNQEPHFYTVKNVEKIQLKIPPDYV